MAIIIFNGKTYNSIEEMPANEKQAFDQLSTMFVDKNGNGIPDFLEGDMVQNVITAYTSSVNINGKTFGNMNDLPDDMQARVQNAFEKMAELGVVTKTTSPMVMQVNGMQMEQKPQTVSAPFISQSTPPSAIQEDRRSNTFVWVLGGIILFFFLLVVVFAVFYFLNK
jgi:hypothetical protein